MKRERPARTVAEWLGVDATLTAPWSDDRPRVVDRDELTAHDRRPPARACSPSSRTPATCRAADGGTWLVPSPTLLDLALQLHDAGIDVELSAQLRDLLRRRLAKVVDDAVKLLVERTGAGFAGNATPAELATAVGALRPIARETTSLILAQEVERALAPTRGRAAGRGHGPRAHRRAADVGHAIRRRDDARETAASPVRELRRRPPA